MSKATFDELKRLRRRAKVTGDAEAGAAAAYELAELRGSFEDLCWVAWFERELGKIGTARLAILEALADNPGHPGALEFLDDLERIESEQSATSPSRLLDPIKNCWLTCGLELRPVDRQIDTS